MNKMLAVEPVLHHVEVAAAGSYSSRVASLSIAVALKNMPLREEMERERLVCGGLAR